MIATRRSLITGLASLLCAPAIVRASSIMPVKAWAAASDPYWINSTHTYRLVKAFGEFKEIVAYNTLNNCYPTIAVALQAANPGDIIVLSPGVYTS